MADRVSAGQGAMSTDNLGDDRFAVVRGECVVNPKTARPFTRHKNRQENLRVQRYTTMHDGEVAATGFAFELVCERCGAERRCEY